MFTEDNSTVRVLIVEDHELTRLTINLVLSQNSYIKIVGLASNGQEAIAMTNLYHPDVIIMDLQMPIMDGLTASSQIKKLHHHTYIIAYSSHEEIGEKIKDQDYPFDNFCPKDVSTTNLVDMIKKLK